MKENLPFMQPTFHLPDCDIILLNSLHHLLLARFKVVHSQDVFSNVQSALVKSFEIQKSIKFNEHSLCAAKQ